MFIKSTTLLIAASLLSTVVYADPLIFSVTNQSNSEVKFGTMYVEADSVLPVYVPQNQTVTNTYENPPKNIGFTIGNGLFKKQFSAMTDPSCDALGIMPLREMTPITKELAQQDPALGDMAPSSIPTTPVTYQAGFVHIFIMDLPGSTPDAKKISCKIVTQAEQ